MTQDRTTSDLFTRDGHVSELTLNRLLARELDDDVRAAIEAHLADCGDCSARRDAVERFDTAFAIAPPAPQAAPVVSLAEARARRGPAFVLVAAAAAVALVFVFARPEPGPLSPGADDGIRLKGAELSLTVFAKTADAPPRAVKDGDVVHPGDRLGFQLRSLQDGYAMVVGIDDRGEVYAGWPQSSGGSAKFLPATDAPTDLGVAVRLDDVGARERLIAVRCPTAFGLAAVAKRLKHPTRLQKEPAQDPLAGCVYDELTLKKQPR